MSQMSKAGFNAQGKLREKGQAIASEGLSRDTGLGIRQGQTWE
jgi:hypothetical protein